MYDVERVYENRFTGERFVPRDASRRLSGFKGRLKGLQRFADAEHMRIYFVTLTLSSSHLRVGSSALNRFLSWLRRRFAARGVSFRYVWVMEYQLKRYARTGDLARHWHLAIAAPLGWLPDVRYDPDAVRHYQVVSNGLVVSAVELFKFWGYGQVLAVLSRGRLAAYLGKYLEKNLDEGVGGRRMYSSSVMGWWSMPAWAFGVVREFAELFDVVKARVLRGVVGRVLHLSLTDGVVTEYYELASPWVRVGV